MKPIFPLLAVAALASSPAFAQVEPGKFAGSVIIGGDFPIQGNVHEGATAQVPNLGVLNPALAGASAELRIGSRSYEKIYGTAVGAALEGAYGVGPNSEVFGTFRYQQADQGRVQVGTAFVPSLNTSLPVFGTFGDLKSYGLEAGYRHHFGSAAWRPYVAGRLGLARTDAIKATFQIPDAAITIANAPFYKQSTSATVGADLGVNYAFNDRWSMLAETGLRYTSDLEGDDSAIGGLGLGSINDAGGRLDASARIGLRAKF